jgi:hypothetical protein
MAPFDGHGQVRHQLRSLVEATGLEKLGKTWEKSWENAMIMEISMGKMMRKISRIGNIMGISWEYDGEYMRLSWDLQQRVAGI